MSEKKIFDAMKEAFECPITKTVMVDPVINTADGWSYERAAIEALIEAKGVSPKTGKPFPDGVILSPNINLRSAIREIFKTTTPSLVELEKAKLENEMLRIKVAEERLRFCLDTYEKYKHIIRSTAECQGRRIENAEINPKMFSDFMESTFVDVASRKWCE